MVGRDTSDSDFNTILKTGGEKKHKLEESEMPSHAHGTHMCYVAAQSGKTVGASWINYDGGEVGTYSAGGSQAHNNLQPYIVVYRWRRIA